MLKTLLAEGRPLLADGATGTNLFAMGLASGDNPELWNADHPDRIRALHQAFVEAGADIILTNSFGGNRRRLMLHDLRGRARELNRRAAEIARDVADKAGRRRRRRRLGRADRRSARAARAAEPKTRLSRCFVEQIEGLKEGGADVAWIETMSAPEEIRAAARAAAAVGMPYRRHRQLRHRGQHDDGPRAGRARRSRPRASIRGRSPSAPIAASAPPICWSSVLGMTQRRPEAAVIAKANAGVPQWHGAHIHYSGTPELMADYARLAVDAGARIVGGCCGNTPRPCRRDASRARRHSPARARPGDDRRRARPAGRPPPPRRAGAPSRRERAVNSKAKQRAWSGRARPSAPSAERGRAPPLADAVGLQVFDVDREARGERLDRFLGRAAAERRIALSRTRLKALIEAGDVTVDGAVARDPATQLTEGARIAFDAPPPADRRWRPRTCRSTSCYEDEHLIVIDKPAGLVVHPARRATPTARWSMR